MASKIAIVHEFFNKLGGAERTLLEMLKSLEGFEVEVFFLSADPEMIKRYLPNVKVHVSLAGKFSWFRKFNRLFVGLFPRMIEGFDLGKFDIVLCSSNSFAHGVISKTEATVICYYHSPCRYLWDWKNEYEKENKLTGIKGVFAKFILHQQRIWDYLAAQRVDIAIANSANVALRIRKYYKRDSQILYPPVELRNFDETCLNWQNRDDFYLIASTITPYKKIDLAIRAFNKLGLKLVVAGNGPQLNELKQMAKSNIEFLGFVSDEKLSTLMSKARGFVFAGEEDFGIAPVEAMGHGCPVIAYEKGGLKETVIEGETGCFFDGSLENLCEKLEWYDQNYAMFDPTNCHRRSLNFSSESFRLKIKQIIQKYV